MTDVKIELKPPRSNRFVENMIDEVIIYDENGKIILAP